MEYTIYKFDFCEKVHFGNHSLIKSNNVFFADTLFSALCIEAVKMGNEFMTKFYNDVKYGKIIFSDAFPYIDDIFYLPKPVKRIRKDEEGNSKIKKAFKSLAYIPCDKMIEYLNGNLNPQDESKYFEENFGQYGTSVSAAVDGLEETMPYHIHYFRYQEGSGLYIIVGYGDDDAKDLFDELIENLTYSGIGGERSSGYGRFEIKVAKMPGTILEMLNNESDEYMSLSISLPSENELEECLCDANYVLVKRSGFVESVNFSDTPKRKKDIFMFQSGSCFKKKFKGDIYDVQSEGKHPVYKYGMALWMGVTV